MQMCECDDGEKCAPQKCMRLSTYVFQNATMQNF